MNTLTKHSPLPIEASTYPWVPVTTDVPVLEHECPGEDEGEAPLRYSDTMLIRYEDPMVDFAKQICTVSPDLPHLVALATFDDEGLWRDYRTNHVYEKVVAWMPVPLF